MRHARHFWRRFTRWISPSKALRQLRRDNVSRSRLAAGLATGVFVANLPAYGLQTAISLYAARRLKLHPLAVLLGAQVSTPPVGPAMVVAAVYVGHLILHGAWPVFSKHDLSIAGIQTKAGALLLEWIVGGVLLGAVMAGITFVVALAMFRVFTRRAMARR